MAYSIIDEYLLDFEIAISSINFAGIPALRKWIHKVIYESIRNTALWPNQMHLFGPKDHLFFKRDIMIIPDSAVLDYAESLIKPDEPKPKNHSEDFISGVTLFFPDGENSSPPESYELIDRTCTGNYAANLNSGSSHRNVYLCIKRSTEGNALTDVGVIKDSELDSLPSGYRVIQMSYYGEEAYIKEDKDNNNSKSFLTYEKAPHQKGYIQDIKVLFDEEIPKVREMKLHNETIGSSDFPVGYTMVKINSFNTKDRTKSIYLCFKRIGGTSLKTLVTQKAESQPQLYKSKSIFNTLSTIKTMAVNEVKDIKTSKNIRRRKSNSLIFLNQFD